MQRQITRFGKSLTGMPTLEVYRGSDGVLMIVDGVTRACRAARVQPGKTIRIEVIDDLPSPVGHLPSVEDILT